MDPLDWGLLELFWEEDRYFDLYVPFGLHHGALYCKRVTQAICHLAKEEQEVDSSLHR